MSDTATAAGPEQARRSTADTLRAIGTFMDQHEEMLRTFNVTVTESDARMIVYCRDREELVITARTIGGRFEKSEDENYFNLERDIAPGVQLQIYTARGQVCERVVTTETITSEVPDPELLAEVPRITVTETVEHVEWVCPPSLLDDQAPVAA